MESVKGGCKVFTIKKKDKIQNSSKKKVYIIFTPWKRRQIARRKAAAEALKGIWANKEDSFFTER